MKMLRDYRLFTLQIKYTHIDHIRVDDDLTGEKRPTLLDQKVKLVARSKVLAVAWAFDRYNSSYLKHTDYSCEVLADEKCPFMLLEMQE